MSSTARITCATEKAYPLYICTHKKQLAYMIIHSHVRLFLLHAANAHGAESVRTFSFTQRSTLLPYFLKDWGDGDRGVNCTHTIPLEVLQRWQEKSCLESLSARGYSPDRQFTDKAEMWQLAAPLRKQSSTCILLTQ